MVSLPNSTKLNSRLIRRLYIAWENGVRFSKASVSITDDTQNPAAWNADNYAMFGEGEAFCHFIAEEFPMLKVK